MQFYDGGTLLGTGTLNGVSGDDRATFTTSALSLGTHTITASYTGDTNFQVSDTALNGWLRSTLGS